jgi:hypothetical protein
MFDTPMETRVPPDLEPQDGIIVSKTVRLMYTNEENFALLTAKTKSTLNWTVPRISDGGTIQVTQEIFTKEAGDTELPNLQNTLELDLNISP